MNRTTEVGCGEGEYFKMQERLGILGKTNGDIKRMKADLQLFREFSPDELDLALDCFRDQLVDNNDKD